MRIRLVTFALLASSPLPGCEPVPAAPRGRAHDPIPAVAPGPPAVAAGPVALASAAVHRGAYSDSPIVADSVRVIDGGGDPAGVPVATLLGGKSVPLNVGQLRGEGRCVVVGLLEYDGGLRPFLVYLSGAEVLNVDVLDP